MTRRAALRAGAGATLAGVLGLGAAGCGSEFADSRVTIGAGGSQGVYFALAGALADAWQRSLGLRDRPRVRVTAGSVDNLALLARGTVDVIFSAADVADDRLTRPSPPGREPRALARIYDDALQVVVPASSGVTTITDLRGKRVSIGATDSGVIVMAEHLLDVAGMHPSELKISNLGIDESAAALRAGSIDAFFWSGGLPTGGVDQLSAELPIRLVDLAPQTAALRKQFPVYDVGTVPAATYRSTDPVTTVFVRNFLLVPSALPEPLAYTLTAGLFAASDRLAATNPAGRAIDTRAAIGTQPVPLHPGAHRYYREAKAYT
ncbi:MAG TPA: TAXI family TRAP transporter solute-binding subunit [Pseudonocardia sp.]|nr:TAXI family TRAP transporter solute-binding subunit [Pseudonocardia sp.]